MRIFECACNTVLDELPVASTQNKQVRDSDTNTGDKEECKSKFPPSRRYKDKTSWIGNGQTCNKTDNRLQDGVVKCFDTQSQTMGSIHRQKKQAAKYSAQRTGAGQDE